MTEKRDPGQDRQDSAVKASPEAQDASFTSAGIADAPADKTPENASEGRESAPFPEALAALRARQILTGGLILLFALGFAFAEREWKLSVLGLFGLWMIGRGAALEKEYRGGRIRETLLICTSVHPRGPRGGVSVGFRSDEERPVFHRYEVSGFRTADEFRPNGLYLVYSAADTPSQLMAWQEI